MNDIERLDKEIEELKKRNLKVEANKAWETSFARMLFISLITYVVTASVLSLIGVDNPFLGGVVPALGYILSTQSLPVIKSWWTRRYLRNHRV